MFHEHHRVIEHAVLRFVSVGFVEKTVRLNQSVSIVAVKIILTVIVFSFNVVLTGVKPRQWKQCIGVVHVTGKMNLYAPFNRIHVPRHRRVTALRYR